jgi:hypothetical protein
MLLGRLYAVAYPFALLSALAGFGGAFAVKRVRWLSVVVALLLVLHWPMLIVGEPAFVVQ